MKTVLRNFLSVLRRFKTASLLNVLGLSIAYVAFMIIMMQVNYDYTFDSSTQNASSIYRLEFVYGKGSQAVVSRPFARAFTESSPHIEAGAITASWQQNNFFFVEREGSKVGYKEACWPVLPELTKVFHFDFIEGSEQALDEPNAVLLPESMAKKLFGNESAMNKQLFSSNPQEDAKIVKGIYKDFPRNSSLQNVIYTAIPPKENFDSWNNQNYFFFIRLDDPSNLETVIDNFKKNFDAKSVFGEDFEWDKDGQGIRLTSLLDLHFLKNIDFDNLPKASHQTLMVLISIAFIILLIAGINFTNFSTALTPMRIKSINTQKVLGSSDRMLRGSLLAEAVGISIVAYLLGLVILSLLSEGPVASLVDADMSFSVQRNILISTAGVSILVGLLAGTYPASYITSFPPALVLKGSFGLSPKGRQMRSVLIGVQFVASFILIIGALFMYLQNYYMQNTPLGYDKDVIITVGLNGNINKSQKAFVNQVKSFSGIEDVTFSESLLSSGDHYMGWGRDYKDESINFQCIPVSSTFLKVMGIEVTGGRDFREEDELKDTGSYIFNEKAHSQYDLQLNDRIGDGEIIGFMPDVKFASFRMEVSPMAFYVWGKYYWGRENTNYFNVAYIKVKGSSNMHAAMDHIQESLRKFDSEYPFSVRFYDEVLQQTYDKELKTSYLITLFSLVAIFISIVGVFGLVVFESEYRRKEIAVRKILGSTISEILYMFNKSYFRILVICFILAAPVGWYAVSKWLENFAYRTPMYLWVYLLAFVVVGIITVLTVTFQNWHVANENPVKNIKNE